MSKIEYPKWLFHKEKDAVIVQDEASHKALGAGWKDSPAHFEEKAEVVVAEVEPVQESLEEAKSKLGKKKKAD